MVDDSGITLGSFGVVGAIFALQFFAEVPKVRKDILQVSGFSDLLMSQIWFGALAGKGGMCRRERGGWVRRGEVAEKHGIYRESNERAAMQEISTGVQGCNP